MQQMRRNTVQLHPTSEYAVLSLHTLTANHVLDAGFHVLVSFPDDQKYHQLITGLVVISNG